VVSFNIEEQIDKNKTFLSRKSTSVTFIAKRNLSSFSYSIKKKNNSKGSAAQI
jgi:hypothetical protein